jgi:hypothetical protein
MKDKLPVLEIILTAVVFVPLLTVAVLGLLALWAIMMQEHGAILWTGTVAWTVSLVALVWMHWTDGEVS